jgi:hypothetical protein
LTGNISSPKIGLELECNFDLHDAFHLKLLVEVCVYLQLHISTPQKMKPFESFSLSVIVMLWVWYLHDGFIFLFFFRSDTEAWFYSWNSSSGQHEDTSWSCWCPYANGEVSLSSLLSVSCIEQVELIMGPVGSLHLKSVVIWSLGLYNSCIILWQIELNWNTFSGKFTWHIFKLQTSIRDWQWQKCHFSNHNFYHLKLVMCTVSEELLPRVTKCYFKTS